MPISLNSPFLHKLARFAVLLFILIVSCQKEARAHVSAPYKTGSRVCADVIQVACIGDSITFGQGVRDPSQDSYPSVLQQLLGSGYTVGNFGVPGAAVLHTVELPYSAQTAYVRALKFAPDVLVIGLGTNDSKYIFDPQKRADFTADYEDLVASFRRINPDVKVYLFLPIPSYPQTRSENVTLKTSILPLIRQVARDAKGQLIDLNTLFTDKQNLYYDGFHPNEQGAKIIASQVNVAITQSSKTSK